MALEGLVLVLMVLVANQVGAQPSSGSQAASQQGSATTPDIRLSLPRPVQAVGAAVGLGRPRLALVLAVQSVGKHAAVPTAARDAAAVAQTLRNSGYIVMLRVDPGARELRSTLNEFRGRLQPGTAGFVYLTGPGLAVEGQNAVLVADANVAPDMPSNALQVTLRTSGVPLAEVVEALAGTPESPRLLVVDAAFSQPGWLHWPTNGLRDPKPPRGMMVLLAQALGAQQPPEPASGLPEPAPVAPREVAASRFARAVVDALQTPRLSGPEVLRATREAVIKQSGGQVTPWLGGDSDESEDFVDPTILDSMIPKTPEDVAREFARQSVRMLDGGGAPAQAAKLANTANDASTAASDSAAPTAGPSVPGLVPLAAAVGAVAAGAGTAAASVGTTAAGAAAVVGASTAAGGVGTLAQSAMSKALSVAGSAAAAVADAAPAVGSAAVTRKVASGAPVGAAAATATAAAAAAADNLARSPQAARTVRAPGGGERPAFAPRRNAYGYAEGDTYTYRVIDLWKDEVHADIVTGVDRVLDDGRLLGNDNRLVMDPQGRPVSQVAPDGTLSRFDPCQALWWSRPKRGEDRPVRFKETFERPDGLKGEIEWVGSATVGRPRKIEVGSSTFEVVPIESSGWNYQLRSDGTRSSVRWSRTVWYDLGLGHPVAIDIEDHDTSGRRLTQERVELMHAQTHSQADPKTARSP